MDFNDSFVLLLTCCSSRVAFRPFINRERPRPSYFPTPATILLTFAARLRRFCQFLVSRGWIRNLAVRCPDVGLDFCLVAIFGAKGSKGFTRKSKEVLLLGRGIAGEGGTAPQESLFDKEEVAR